MPTGHFPSKVYLVPRVLEPSPVEWDLKGVEKALGANKVNGTKAFGEIHFGECCPPIVQSHS